MDAKPHDGKSGMDRARPSVMTAVFWAYWDLCRAFAAMWRLWLVAFVILCVGLLAMLIGPVRLTYEPFGQLLARLLLLAGLCFLLTPFLLATHRFVILGEVARRYEFELSSPRFRLYCGWLVVAAVLLSVPSMLDVLAAPRGPVYYVGRRLLDPEPSLIIELARRFAPFILVQCFLLLFPAVAVDARGATWQNAFRDTFNRIWFVIAASLLPFVPLLLLGKAATSLSRILPRTLIGASSSVLLLGAICLVILVLAAVIASRLYQIVGDRLNARLPAT